MEERLNKILARAGLASRRGADTLIESGRVTVNGKIVTKLGTKVDPSSDDIRFDGEHLRLNQGQSHYIAFYKPPHVITTLSDPFNRAKVMDFIDIDARLFPVGRLDGNSEGLLILTNDGQLANQLTHPRYEHEKEYRVKISGTPLEGTLQKWREGMWLDEGRTLPADVKIESSTGSGTWLRFVIREGKNRQIRRMIETFKHRIHKLVRIRVGPILLGTLTPGKWRKLRTPELDALIAGTNQPVHHSDAPVVQESKKRPKYKTGWAKPKAKPNRRTETKGGSQKNKRRSTNPQKAVDSRRRRER